MAVLYTNNAVSALSASITSTATSFSVTAGHGVKFPALSGADYFYVTLSDNAGNIEIVKATARATDTFTVVRAQDGTSGLAFTAADKVELRVTKAVLDDIKTDTKSSLTSGNVTTALGFTPYNATNPTGYITSAGNAATATTATNQSGGTVNATTGAFSSTVSINGGSGLRAFVDGGASITSHIYFANANNNRAYNWQLDENSNAALWGYNGSAWAKLLSVTSAGALNTVGAITQNGSQVLTAGNYNSYAPTLTGTGASGTWGISISGTAATATSAPNYLPLAGGTMTGPMYTATYDNSSKVMFNSASTYYLGLTGNVATGGGSLSMVQYSNPDGTAAHAVNSYPLLHSNNYNSYSPTLTGTGASGTWGISISGSSASCTGNAATATTATTATTANALNTSNNYSVNQLLNNTWYNYNDNDRNAGSATYYPNVSTRAVRFFFANASATGTGGNFAGVMQFNPWDGTTSSTGDASYQLAFGSTATNSGGVPQLNIRKGIDTTWNSWYTLLHSGNYTSYAPSLTGSGASGTWGISISGNAATATGGITTSNYTAYAVKRTGSVGNANLNSATYYTGSQVLGYDTATNMPGSSYGTMISINERGDTCLQLVVDYSSGYLFSRGIYTGSPTYSPWRTCLNDANYTSYAMPAGSSATNSVDVRAPIFYDSNNTGYYVDPSAVGPSAALASSIWIGIQSGTDVLWDYASGGTYRPGMQVRGSYPHMDLFSTVGNGAHGPTLRFAGYTNGSSGAFKHWVIGTAGSDLTFLDFGFASDAANPHQGISGYSGTTIIRATTSGNVGVGGNWGAYGSGIGSPSYPLHVIGIAYATASSRAPLFYDSDNTGYYVDPASTSNLVGLTVANTISGSISGNAATSSNTSSISNAVGGTYTWTGINYFRSNRNTDSSSPSLEAYSDDGNGAIMAFHRSGYYAINMGLDSDNVFRLRGWSSGFRWSSDTAGNFNTGGYISAASYVASGSDIYTNSNYGYQHVGLYYYALFQGVFAMGDAYKLTAGGAISNLYGMTWSYPSAGGIAGNLSSHGMIVAINGGFGSCMSYNVTASANVTAYSDERLKRNWEPLCDNFVEKLAGVKVGTYERIDQPIVQVGVSAQSLEKVIPEAVSTATDEMQTKHVSYGNAALASAVMLAKELVELKQMIKQMQEEIAELKRGV